MSKQMAYIVTAGEYSDYGIQAVFLDKEKAEEYAKLTTGEYHYPVVEEYEIYTGYDVREVQECELWALFTGTEMKWDYFKVGEMSKKVFLHGHRPPTNTTSYPRERPWRRLSLRREMKPGETAEEAERRMKQIAIEKVRQINSLLEQGVGEAAINEILGGEA